MHFIIIENKSNKAFYFYFERVGGIGQPHFKTCNQKFKFIHIILYIIKRESENYIIKIKSQIK